MPMQPDQFANTQKSLIFFFYSAFQFIIYQDHYYLAMHIIKLMNQDPHDSE